MEPVIIFLLIAILFLQLLTLKSAKMAVDLSMRCFELIAGKEVLGPDSDFHMRTKKATLKFFEDMLKDLPEDPTT